MLPAAVAAVGCHALIRSAPRAAAAAAWAPMHPLSLPPRRRQAGAAATSNGGVRGLLLRFASLVLALLLL